MQGLEYFITVIVPATIFLIIAFAGFVGFIASIYNRVLENQVERIENMMDAYHYEIKQLKKRVKQLEEQKKCGKKYATITEAATVFKQLQQEGKVCQPITLKSQTQQFVKSSTPPSLRIRVESSNCPRIYRHGLTRIGTGEVEITSLFTS